MAQSAAEVLIIGGGIAGLATALELLDHDRSVVMLDRDEPENFGGLAKESFGGLFFVGSAQQKRNGIKDSPELALADWRSFAEFGPEDVWPQAWAEAYVHRCTTDVQAWLMARGVRFLPLPIWIERGDTRPGNSVPRFHMVWGTGQELIARLVAALESHPRRDRLTVHFRYRVESLIVEGGRVVGCRGLGEADGRPFELRAERIVVASGGINGNLDKVRAHWHRDWARPPAVILNGSHKFADGRVHDAVAEAGGRLTHLDKMWNYASGVHHYRPRKPVHGLSLVPPKTALWLDGRGERIGPQPLVSGFDTRGLITGICAAGSGFSWQVLNRKIALKELAVSGAEFNPSIRNKSWFGFVRDLLFGNRWLVDELTGSCADIVTADSLSELAAKMNALQGDAAIDAERLTAAVHAFDSNPNDPQRQKIAELRRYKGDRLRTHAFGKIDDPKARPLIAIREFVVSRKSLGGIQTDLSGRALDGRGEPIPGLYAVGEAAGFGGGGMHGLRALEGTFLGGCLLTGRMCGRAIAGKEP